jgi:hypothetical protein
MQKHEAALFVGDVRNAVLWMLDVQPRQYALWRRPRDGGWRRQPDDHRNNKSAWIGECCERHHEQRRRHTPATAARAHDASSQ